MESRVQRIKPNLFRKASIFFDFKFRMKLGDSIGIIGI